MSAEAPIASSGAEKLLAWAYGVLMAAGAEGIRRVVRRGNANRRAVAAPCDACPANGIEDQVKALREQHEDREEADRQERDMSVRTLERVDALERRHTEILGAIESVRSETRAEIRGLSSRIDTVIQGRW